MSRRIVAVPSQLVCVVAPTFLHFTSLCRAWASPTSRVNLTIGILAQTSLATGPILGIWMARAGRRGFLLARAQICLLAPLR